MIMDILTCAILLISAFFYMRKGFAMSVMCALEWFTASAASLFFCDNVTGMIAKSGLGKAMEERLAGMIDSTTDASTPVGSIPALFNGWNDSDTAFVTTITAEDVNRIFFAIITFFVLTMIFKLLLWAAVKFFDRDQNHGMIAFIDTLGGFVMGFIIGIYAVLLLFLLIVAGMAVFPAGFSEAIQSSFANSAFSGSLYQHNFLLTLLHILSL